MKLPDMDQISFIASEVSREVVEETLLILQEGQCDYLLELDEAVPRGMFSAPDLLQGF